MRFFLFRIIFLSLLLGIQYFFFRRSEKYLRNKSASTVVLWGERILFIGMNIPLFFISFYRPPSTEIYPFVLYGVYYPVFLWHGTLVILFLVSRILKLFELPFRFSFWFGRNIPSINNKILALESKPTYQLFNVSRRKFLQNGMISLAGVSFAGTAYGAFVRDDYEITNQIIAIKNLPPQFQNFTISLMSDIHSSVFMPKSDMQKYVAAVNELKSDVIFVTGDFVNSQVEEVYPFAEAFVDLNAQYGVYGCLGNHDFFSNVEIVAKEVEQCGIKLLRDETTRIQKNGENIFLLGVDDFGKKETAEQRFSKLVSKTEMDIPKILLCHRPYFFEQAKNNNIDLTLSGHTHGGQVVFAKFGQTAITPALVASPYIWGLYKNENAQMYVSRGIGTVAIPIRINCPPEITKITLVKG
ncbi:MAG: metallophosphoesterase [Ignavibacteriales bacterium]|nr:metallophosphoesterase [Ignavibacteriales bacterium]